MVWFSKFKGGVHPHYSKLTKKSKLRRIKRPFRVILPMSQHIGAPCKPIVEVGDKVNKYQKVGEAQGAVSVPVHTPISGTVKEIAEKPHPLGKNVLSVIIESDGKDAEAEADRENIKELSVQELRKIIKSAGIAGMGGATFPTHIKLSPPEDKKIDTLIINAAECEPYLTADNRLMVEFPEEIIKGTHILMKILGVEKAHIGIEDNKQDATVMFEKYIEEKNIKDIELVLLKTKYPQGAEKMLIYAVTKKKVPAGGLPMDVGVVVQNVGTAKAVYDAVYKRKPLVERVVTVTGAVKEPANLVVRIGTPVKDLIEECGGYIGEPVKLIAGGPMMGLAQLTDEIPVIKGTSGILVQAKTDVCTDEERDCIRCGKCIDVCPMFLTPTAIAQNVMNKHFDRAKENFALDCFECGACAYICPSKIPLVHYIKHAKDEIMKEMKKEKVKEEPKKEEKVEEKKEPEPVETVEVKEEAPVHVEEETPEEEKQEPVEEQPEEEKPLPPQPEKERKETQQTLQFKGPNGVKEKQEPVEIRTNIPDEEIAGLPIGQLGEELHSTLEPEIKLGESIIKLEEDETQLEEKDGLDFKPMQEKD